MAATWVPSDVTKGGHALWLTRLGVLTINSIRKYGLPSGTQTLQIPVPTLGALAQNIYVRCDNEITAIKPSEQPIFFDPIDDV